jgi:glucokinase
VTESTKADPKLVYATDLGGTHLRVALVDETGKIHTQVKHQTPHGTTPDSIVDAIVSGIKELKDSHAGDAIAASIVVPGIVDKENKYIFQAPNLPALDNFGLKQVLQEQLQLPVLLENDANAAAVGETWLGAARGARNVICITLGTGVGGGIILDGKLWRGTDGSAGELGHTTVEPFTGPPCKCGNTGCLEMYASATAIVRMTREALERFPDSTLRDQCLTSLKVYDAAKSGDELALSVFKTSGQYLGVAIVNLINTLAPEVIVVGGGGSNAWDLLEPEIREQIRRRAFSSLALNVLIRQAECGDNAGLLGAAKLAFDLN